MQYVKNNGNQWFLTEYETEDAVLNVASIKLKLPLEELYKKVNLLTTVE